MKGAPALLAERDREPRLQPLLSLSLGLQTFETARAQAQAQAQGRGNGVHSLRDKIQLPPIVPARLLSPWMSGGPAGEVSRCGCDCQASAFPFSIPGEDRTRDYNRIRWESRLKLEPAF